MKLTPAQIKFMSRFEATHITVRPTEAGEIPVCNGQGATAAKLVKIGLIVFTRRDEYGIEWVRKA